MEKSTVQGVRKGAWTKEEDILLRKCIEEYGEGKWHLVPLRAALNRCRKSCRLRWLNYLRPNLKRGYFNKDEVDLILRLHKLLGNRWSLIAGRLPGRTANDVKNFWNTHMEKKSAAADAGESLRRQIITPKTITGSNIIRPRPRTFSKLLQVPSISSPNNDENPKKNIPSSSETLSREGPINDWTNSDENPANKKALTSLSSKEVDECIQWWGSLLEITENNGAGASLFSFSGEDHRMMELCPTSSSPGLRDSANDYANHNSLVGNVDVWELLNLHDS